MAGDSGGLGDVGLEGGFGGEPAPLFRPDSGPGFSVPGQGLLLQRGILGEAGDLRGGRHVCMQGPHGVPPRCGRPS